MYLPVVVVRSKVNPDAVHKPLPRIEENGIDTVRKVTGSRVFWETTEERSLGVQRKVVRRIDGKIAFVSTSDKGTRRPKRRSPNEAARPV